MTEKEAAITECKTCKGFKDKYCVQTGTMIPCPDCQNKMKPLAQYLGEYVEQELKEQANDAVAWWCELLEQALDAYESTEQVKIKIERV